MILCSRTSIIKTAATQIRQLYWPSCSSKLSEDIVIKTPVQQSSNALITYNCVQLYYQRTFTGSSTISPNIAVGNRAINMMHL